MTDKSKEREKKKRIAIIAGGIVAALLIILAILLGVLLPKSCAKSHSHTFDKEVAEADYLKSEANHTSGAIYYKSCECGAQGTDEDTFVYGEAAHTYDKEVVDADYLKSEANHTSGAIYYKSCECGAKGTDDYTFEYGYYLPTEGLRYNLNAAGEYTLMGRDTATDTHIVIADVYEGKPVTAINIAAFVNCSWLTSIVIPDSVTNIPMSVFMGCSNLTSVRLSDNITIINSNIFNGCTKLQSINISDKVTSIGASAFNNCTSLTTVYYKGTEADWENINIISTGNDALIGATKYYYVENAEDVPGDGNYWHYDSDGITPVIWSN